MTELTAISVRADGATMSDLSTPSGRACRAERPMGPVRSTVATLRSLLVAAVVAAMLSVAGIAVTGGSDAAAFERLPTNTLAPYVTTSARSALDSHDKYLATGDHAAYRSFIHHRTQTAELAATELGYGERDMIDAWANTTEVHQRAVLAAMTQVGVPYRTNTSKPGVGFDCSGLTTYAFSQAGVQLTRQSSAQIREAQPLDRATAKAGDLVQYPGHVMMYLGVGDAVVHSVMSGRTVELDTISERRSNSVRFGDPTS